MEYLEQTESTAKWLPESEWSICGFPVDPTALRGRDCYGGLDLSSTTATTAWILVFPPVEEGGRYEVLCRFFLPADNLTDRVQREKVPYNVWAHQGMLTLTPGKFTDSDFILARIKKDMGDYRIIELAFDRWASNTITKDLQELGFRIEGNKRLIPFGQGFASMSAPMKDLKKMVLAGEIAHGGNPVMASHASNLAVRMDPAGNIMPDKSKSLSQIAGAVALIMAIGLAGLRRRSN